MSTKTQEDFKIKLEEKLIETMYAVMDSRSKITSKGELYDLREFAGFINGSIFVLNSQLSLASRKFHRFYLMPKNLDLLKNIFLTGNDTAVVKIGWEDDEIHNSCQLQFKIGSSPSEVIENPATMKPQVLLADFSSDSQKYVDCYEEDHDFCISTLRDFLGEEIFNKLIYHDWGLTASNLILLLGDFNKFCEHPPNAKITYVRPNGRKYPLFITPVISRSSSDLNWNLFWIDVATHKNAHIYDASLRYIPDEDLFSRKYGKSSAILDFLNWDLESKYICYEDSDGAPELLSSLEYKIIDNIKLSSDKFSVIDISNYRSC